MVHGNDAGDLMNAIELLKKQHKEVKALFAKLEEAEGAKKREVFEELAANLAAHDGIERKLFYPACEAELGKDDVLGESIVEHGVIEFMLYRADLSSENEDFEYELMVLKEAVLHHVKEEEDELLPEAKRALSEEQLEQLGAKMETEFDKALSKDFRAAVRAQLKKVLAGSYKAGADAKPARAKKSTTSKTRSKNSRSTHA
jgi:hypothetical protein